MEPPSPQTLELLLTKLARLRLKVADLNRAELQWVKLDSWEHRQAAWQLEGLKLKLAEAETLVWLAFREKERWQAEQKELGALAYQVEDTLETQERE